MTSSGEKISSMYFPYFLIISLWKRRCHLLEQNWIPFTQGCFMLSLVEIGPVVQYKKGFFLISSIFFSFIYPNFEKARSFHLNKLEFPLPCLPSLVEIGRVILEKHNVTQWLTMLIGYSLYTANWNSFVDFFKISNTFDEMLNLLSVNIFLTLIISCFCQERLNEQRLMFETKTWLFLADLLLKKCL